MSTPLMQQYQSVKSRYPDTILLFRMGDFFETFEEDAKVTSRVLGITLTKRGNGAAGEVPLAGFPHHALEAYLPKLVRAGYRVAVCEQLEDPKFAKGIVKRDVIEVVTPGVAFSDKVLNQKQNNFLAAVALGSPLATSADILGCAWVDVSTGEFAAGEFPLARLADHLAGLGVSEVLVQKRDVAAIERILANRVSCVLSKLDDWVFNRDYGYEALLMHFKTQSLKGFGLEELTVGIVAAGAVMHYLQETQKSNLPHIRKIVPVDIADFISLDPATKRNLEITSTMSGATDGTLFSVLDRTCTPMGGRQLKQWVHRPLKRPESLRERLSSVGELVEQNSLRRDAQEIMSNLGDMERLLGRIATGRSGPRELTALKASLRYIPAIQQKAGSCASATLTDIATRLAPMPVVVDRIEAAIADDPPAAVANGGVIRKGYSAELDEVRGLSHGAKDWIARMQQSERERTGIGSLKVGYNNVFGYYIEITNSHKDKVPADYIRKQTLANAERYITPDLKEYEEKVMHAEERILQLETTLFHEVREFVAARSAEIQENARLLATFDCLASLAQVAVENKYVRPMIDDSESLEIVEGRHPVIEQLLPPGEHYQPNDCSLDTEHAQIVILTGPNMSGKSSFLRQVGLIVLLAQIGSFVPAKSARIGLVDRIFTRVGANDNIAAGESTFLVEMHEAAQIVNTATRKSLILLDEVGRGTSTFDGISIAWALTEFIHQRIGAKTLFATHYHELNELTQVLPRVKNFKVDVREYGDKVVFLHRVLPGFADHSYGIQVAQMAGLPSEVTDRAALILKNLESSELITHGRSGKKEGEEFQMQLFEVKDDKLRDALRKIDPDRMTPLDALQRLAQLKKDFDV
ncbi:MAG: DNA mismatch repair protein MutS [Ignavibacteria bacterium GWA2_55_11]|nr:MAG: DNA mismatch repair protein MutS [Ignavibacteria bacterium GWA2_55_11]OGU46457.1 MAG: DNA mismatch repair protein MutS [Ignavibacteria bacterium GWC2_56_12]OGU75219.1 MAG: DNA mismatch repair protein MutS [Ignavibacteria bacterium RIFCSPLOWO2_12_FULL_56_21]